MTEQSIYQLVGSLGFPIAIAFYFMTVLNKTLKVQTEMLGALKNAIEKLCEAQK